MTMMSPKLISDFIKTVPQEARGAAQQDLTVLMQSPYSDINARIQCRALLAPIGLLDYALRFGTAASACRGH